MDRVEESISRSRWFRFCFLRRTNVWDGKGLSELLLAARTAQDGWMGSLGGSSGWLLLPDVTLLPCFWVR